MPSTFSTALRLNFQAPGENLNTWGSLLNAGVFQLVEDAVAGVNAFTLSGPRTLTSVNGATDEARRAVINVTGGTGGTITVPAVVKSYFVRNAASGDVVITTGSGTSATVKPGEVVFVNGDGTNFYKALQSDMGGAKITSLGTPTNNTDAATKAYVDQQAWNAQSGNLPGQSGNAGKFLTTNGTTPSWATVTVTTSQITDYASDQAAKAAAATRLAVAFAAAL